jgi:acetyl-CoA carboxylase biotin carboxylase subunit
MFKKILIANRGEIALRVIVACRELGHQRRWPSTPRPTSIPCTSGLADEDVCIGPAAERRQLSERAAIISAAEITGADAIHPGYGFLSESAYSRGLRGVPHPLHRSRPERHRLLGDKARARRR